MTKIYKVTRTVYVAAQTKQKAEDAVSNLIDSTISSTIDEACICGRDPRGIIGLTRTDAKENYRLLTEEN